jgi:hypothetical protein
MNQKNYEKVISTFAKAKLGGSLKGVMDNADDAWKSARDAISLIDYKNDAVKGEQALEETLDALNLWLIRLEIIENGSKEIAKRAHQAIHARGRDTRLEEDSEGYGDDEISVEANWSRGQNVKTGTRNGKCRRRNDRIGAFGNSNTSERKSINKKGSKNNKKNRKISCGEF